MDQPFNRLSYSSRPRWFDYLLLTGLCLVLFGFTAAYERVLTSHETVHCLNVREMLASGDYVVPTYGGRVWLERPPLPHWLTALLAAPFGAGEQVWTYRLGSHLAGLICVLLTAWMGSVCFGRGLGILSGAVLATMLEFYQYATVTEADIGLCLIVTCAMACFVKVEFGRRSPHPQPLSLRARGELDFPHPQTLSARGEGELESLHPQPFSPQEGREGFFGKRSVALAGFFFFLGLTNLAKGLFFGSLFILLPVGGFLLAKGSWQGLRRYLWLWGWLLGLATAAAWALAAWTRYPDIVDLWHSDYMGRVNHGFMKEPVWYYFAYLPILLFPWVIPTLAGLIGTARAALKPGSVERFLWCWAWLPILFFSIPQGKHHHYLLHCMPPWAVLGALGARRLWTWLAAEAPRWIRNPLLPVALLGLGGDAVLYHFRHQLPGVAEWFPALAIACPLLLLVFWWGSCHPRPAVAFSVVFGALVCVYCFAWTYRADHLNHYEKDQAFLRRTRGTVPPGTRIYVKGDSHPLNGSWLLFYLGEPTVFLHNLTFLRDENIRERSLYLVGRIWDEEELTKYGQAERIDQSMHTRGEENERDRYALFRFTYREDLARLPASRAPITPCQATARASGPFLE